MTRTSYGRRSRGDAWSPCILVIVLLAVTRALIELHSRPWPCLYEGQQLVMSDSYDRCTVAVEVLKISAKRSWIVPTRSPRIGCYMCHSLLEVIRPSRCPRWSGSVRQRGTGGSHWPWYIGAECMVDHQRHTAGCIHGFRGMKCRVMPPQSADTMHDSRETG